MADQEKFSVAVVGATGLVGQEMLAVLEDRNFPVKNLGVFASENSAGEELEFKSEYFKVEELGESSFKGRNFDFVLFGTSAELSAKYAPLAAQSGAVAIDNSSYFRMNPEIPLIVPEVNPDDLLMATSHRIIANPNCSTIQLVCCLKPLDQKAKLKRVVVSSYQSVSGAGSAALDELQEQIGALFSQTEVKKKVFPHQIAFNCIPHIDSFVSNGFTKEEMKIINESRKILGLPSLKITATAVRVPTLISHSESVNIETEKELSPEAARDCLEEAGVVVVDEPEKNRYPLAFEATGSDLVFAGRIRRDESVTNGLHLWVVADNLRKGAATNAVQIAELCIARKFLSSRVQ
ncbi:MAG: aspartate-semialdehyde dehydrogenase [Deltaproteobacteria bacterium]|nr:aspartate-semialdehyde dehydrogenase [Deltaproteobacteria bacterium]